MNLSSPADYLRAEAAIEASPAIPDRWRAQAPQAPGQICNPGPGHAAGTPSERSQASVDPRTPKPHVDADAGEPHRIAMREIGRDDRYGVLSVCEVHIERLRPHSYAIRPR